MMKFTAKSSLSLLDALSIFCPDSSKSTLRSWIKEGRVEVNGKAFVNTATILSTGDLITVGTRKRFIDEQLELLYEDRYLVVVNKAEGLLSVATAFEKAKTAHGLLKEHYRPGRIFPVHRLDQDASGVLVFTRTAEARDAMREVFEKHLINRTYYAVLEGIPEESLGTWKSFQWEDANYYVHNSDDPQKGKEAITHYQVIKCRKNRSLLEIKLETGRKNQIRAHCSWKGFPILGDKKYGALNNMGKRLCLHAYTLGFNHPFEGTPMLFTAPIPIVFNALVK